MTGGQAVVEALRVEGIEHVFGIVGTHNVHLFDGLFDLPDIKLVTPRHEQGATLMATGYARASGRIAACFTVPGPGVTNALTGLGMAYSESAPVLLVAGQNPLATLERGLDLFHELPSSLSVAGALSSYAMRASSAGDIPRVIREALRTMRCQRPRPAYVEVPLDVLGADAEISLLPPEEVVRPNGDPAAIERAARALVDARRPIILAGGGVVSADGGEPLRLLAERLGAPVLSSAFAKGILSEDHPLALGDGWGQRRDLYAEVLEGADLALVVGYRFDVISDAQHGAGLPKRVIQVDLDPRVLGQRSAIEVGVLGDAAAVLRSLVDAVGRSNAAACWLDVTSFVQRKQQKLAEMAGPVLPIIQDLRAALPRDAVVVDDLTLVGYWAPLLFTAYRPRSLLHAGTYGTLGYAVPAAIGAKIACPSRPVVAIVGDGGLLYSVQELATAVAERLDLVVLLFNDNAFGALKTYQDRFFGARQIGADLVNPDFLKLADAFGFRCARIAADEVGDTVARAVEDGGQWLIEVPFTAQPPASIPPWMA